MGMEKIIFDKYNTLIRHGEVDFPDPSFKEALFKVYDIFGRKNVFLVSNTTSNNDLVCPYENQKSKYCPEI